MIFQAALNHYAIEGRQAWHVGDSLREDVEGAMAAGVNVALLDRDNRFRQKIAEAPESQASINSLLYSYHKLTAKR